MGAGSARMSSPQAFTSGFVMRASPAQEPAHDTRRRPPFRTHPSPAPLFLALPPPPGPPPPPPFSSPSMACPPLPGAAATARKTARKPGVSTKTCRACRWCIGWRAAMCRARGSTAPACTSSFKCAMARTSPSSASAMVRQPCPRPTRRPGWTASPCAWTRRPPRFAPPRRGGWNNELPMPWPRGCARSECHRIPESPKTRTLETNWMETDTFAPAYELPSWPFEPPPELGGSAIRRHPIVIVGAGLAGLTLACDLAQRGVRAVLLDEDDTVGVRGASSRGICYAQKSLEIFERLGLYRRVADKGITWSFGRTFSGETEVYNFNLQTGSVSAQPPFIHLQPFYVEWFLVDRILELGLTDVRWKNRATHVEPLADGARLEIETPAGAYAMETDYLIDATGANSPIRTQLGIEGHASRSTDRWCISAVRFKKTIPVAHSTFVD